MTIYGLILMDPTFNGHVFRSVRSRESGIALLLLVTVGYLKML